LIVLFFNSDDIAVLKSRVEELEDSERKLLKLKEENEADFGQKRARFRELFMQKEGLLMLLHCLNLLPHEHMIL
jgi:hypothetical protein